MESLGVPRVKASLLLELHMIQKNNNYKTHNPYLLLT